MYQMILFIPPPPSPNTTNTTKKPHKTRLFAQRDTESLQVELQCVPVRHTVATQITDGAFRRESSQVELPVCPDLRHTIATLRVLPGGASSVFRLGGG